MGTITTGVGLISGIDIASLVDSLIAVESQGKIRLQRRMTSLQAQQTALLDINARLLNFKNIAASFRIEDIFQSSLATSNNEDILTAVAGAGAQPGSFAFIVKQLVQTSQRLSKGYASADQSPLGLESISFEFGRGMLSRDVALEDLNGGQGVDRGRITINDSSGASATIDLTDVTTLNEIIERINGNASVSVTASVDGDHLVITDDAGGAGALTISNGAGDTTATDLGIAGADAGGAITGTNIVFIGGNTALASLNDGTGVLVQNNVTDLQITARDGTTFTVDFGRIDEDIADATLLADLNNGAGITFDDDPDTPDIKFVDRTGTEHEVDLTGLTTVGGLKTRIANATGGAINIEVVTGDRFKVIDTTGGEAGNLKVLGAGDTGTDAAEDLGILNEEGEPGVEFTGSIVPSLIDQPKATTLQEIIDRINNAEGNGGKVIASIAANGVSLQVDDTTGSTASNLIVASTTPNPHAASDLGIEANVAADTISGERLVAGLNSVLVRSLNGGNGLDGATTITISDRNNNSFTLNDLDTYESLSEIVAALNEAAANDALPDPAAITVSLNSAGNGLLITDTSGGSNNLTISGDASTALGIEADVAEDSVHGANLQLSYVSQATRLDDLNYGRGISTGSFRITDGLGQSATVSIGGTEETVFDVIQEINSRGLAILARINDQGDGIIIEEDPAALAGQTPFVPIKVANVSGTTGSDLNLVGESEEVIGGSIDGSYERVVDLSTSDSLADVASKINNANIPVNASVINTGSGAAPYRLNLTSAISGRSGELVIDTGGVDLGLTTLSEGADAKVFFGSENPEDGFLITSPTNVIEGVLPGVTIDLHQASDDPVTLTISRDTETIVATVNDFVGAFNEVIKRINAYDFYNVDTEEKGVLLGNATTGRIRDALYRAATGRALNVSGTLQYLTQIGIRFNSDGEMTFDEDRFREAYAEDPAAMESLFAEYDISIGSTEQIADGVTVDHDDTNYNALGFGNLFDRLLDELTNSIDGMLTLADKSYQSQIDLLETRIEDLDQRLEVRREQLTAEFIAMEQALSRLQLQSQSLTSLASNVRLAGQQLNLFGLAGGTA